MLPDRALTIDQRKARGDHAKRLLGDELLNEALDTIENQWLKAIADSVPSEAEKRELAYTMLYGIKRFRAELQSFVNDAALLRHKTES